MLISLDFQFCKWPNSKNSFDVLRGSKVKIMNAPGEKETVIEKVYPWLACLPFQPVIQIYFLFIFTEGLNGLDLRCPSVLYKFAFDLHILTCLQY